MRPTRPHSVQPARESTILLGLEQRAERAIMRYREIMATRFRGFVFVVAMGVPCTASAHAYVMEPVSRDAKLVAALDDRAYKNTEGPCGVVLGTATPLPRTDMPTQYDVGATITVKWQETIDHRGCFQVLLSEANDQNWTILAQYDDPTGSPDDEITTKRVKLPDGVSCKDCTLSVRQLMTGSACPANAESVPQTTYYSCADIRIGSFDGAGPSQPPTTPPTTPGGTSSGTDPEPSEEEASSPGSRRLRGSNPEASSCAIGPGRSWSPSILCALGLAALVRSRRRRSMKLRK